VWCDHDRLTLILLSTQILINTNVIYILPLFLKYHFACAQTTDHVAGAESCNANAWMSFWEFDSSSIWCFIRGRCKHEAKPYGHLTLTVTVLLIEKRVKIHDQMNITSSNHQMIKVFILAEKDMMFSWSQKNIKIIFHGTSSPWLFWGMVRLLPSPLMELSCSMLFPQERFGWYPHDGSMGRLYLEPYMKTINIKQI